MALLPKILPLSEEEKRAKRYRQVLRFEAKKGGELFGPLPARHRRQFFCLDDYTWVWYEEWTDAKGRPQAVTTTYNIRSDQVLKTQNNGHAQPVSGSELKNLYRAIKLYGERVPGELQKLLNN